MEFYNLHTSLREVGESLSNRLKSLVPVSTGRLKNSISYRVNKNELEIVAEDYFKYLDKGVNGTEVNYGSLYSFRTKMPPTSVPTLSDKFAIATSIFKKGIKPHNFTKNLDTQDDKIVDGLSEDIKTSFKKSLDAN